MQHIIHQTDFKTLRQAYIEIKSFIENETAGKVWTINTKIENDLGCAGDDSWELIDKFVTTYTLNSADLDLSKHFLSEGELFNSETALLTLLSLPISVAVWLIKMMTFGKVDWTQKQFFSEYYRETSDMTFGDMLTWYLTGSYHLRKNVSVVLQLER